MAWKQLLMMLGLLCVLDLVQHTLSCFIPATSFPFSGILESFHSKKGALVFGPVLQLVKYKWLIHT